MSTWCETNPKLQKAWDSTSLQDLCFCPRYYQYSHLEGWRGSSADLEFGGFVATAQEHYHKARLNGESKAEAQFSTLKLLLEQAGQWGGRFETMWHCKGETPYKNEKGNRAVCPYAKKGVWLPMPAPDVCGECGSPTEGVRQYIPDHSTKNLVTLVRLVLWYIEEQPEEMEDGLHPLKFRDGTPAVELSWRLPLPINSPDGDPYLLCGHFDYLGEFGNEHFVVDGKTTTKTPSKSFFDSYDPHIQIDTYDMVADMLFPDLEIQGVLLDASQVMQSGSRFARHQFYRSEEQRDEHYHELVGYIRDAERYAEADHWPMNKRNCWICPFKGVCSKPPHAREMHLKSNFEVRERWDPLVER